MGQDRDNHIAKRDTCVVEVMKNTEPHICLLLLITKYGKCYCPAQCDQGFKIPVVTDMK